MDQTQRHDLGEEWRESLSAPHPVCCHSLSCLRLKQNMSLDLQASPTVQQTQCMQLYPYSLQQSVVAIKALFPLNHQPRGEYQYYKYMWCQYLLNMCLSSVLYTLGTIFSLLSLTSELQLFLKSTKIRSVHYMFHGSGTVKLSNTIITQHKKLNIQGQFQEQG